MIYDFDAKTQKAFTQFAAIPVADWKQWLAIGSKEEYESAALKLSGMAKVDDFFERAHTEKTDPHSFSVQLESVLQLSPSDPVIFCHTSGTSGGSIDDIKWFHMSRELVQQLWAPGMVAIFESSGLCSSASAAVFVPSRAKTDGVSAGDPSVVKLYSAEFSQRLVLSVVHPRSYLLYEYKDARSIPVLAKMLSMDNIAVVSAPYLAVLGWADMTKLTKSIKKSLEEDIDEKKETSPETSDLLNMIKKKGVKAAAARIHTRISRILSDATFIFSTTGMTEKDWNTLRKFLKWEPGKEKFTNLYVGSEVGPFAASIGSDSKNEMYVFPLTVPVIEAEGTYRLITESSGAQGKLLVSRMHNGAPVINIDTGDVITLQGWKGLPIIKGKILRSKFPLKTDVSLSTDTGLSGKETILVGNYFDLKGLTIENARQLPSCLAQQCNFDRKSPLLLKKERGTWIMVVPLTESLCDPAQVVNALSRCPAGQSLKDALHKEILQIELTDKPPVQSVMPRSELLKRVRKGELPKGVLMRWPLYVVVPSKQKELES